MAIRRISEHQLAFDLDLDEAADDAAERAITPEEARQISEMARQALEQRYTDQPAEEREERDWFGDYLRLREQGWPWRVAAYLAWESAPKRDRWPTTLAELATQLGLRSSRVIHTWRKKYPAIDTVVAMLQAAPLFEHRRDVVEALIEAAKGDYKGYHDRRLFFEMIGDYVPRSKVELGKAGKADDLHEKSDEELRSWIGEEDQPSPFASEAGAPSPETGEGIDEEDDE